MSNEKQRHWTLAHIEAQSRLKEERFTKADAIAQRFQHKYSAEQVLQSASRYAQTTILSIDNILDRWLSMTEDKLPIDK